ncbi:SRPBCC domain-containing protein [Calidifontibacter terrae]
MTSDQFRRALIGTSDQRSLSVQRDYLTDPADLWAALTHPERLARWFGTLRTIPSGVADSFVAALSDEPGDVASGEILVCAPAQHLACSWTYGDEPTGRIDAVIQPVATGTRLLLLHSGVQGSSVADYGAGWEGMLGELARSLGDSVVRTDSAQPWAALAQFPLEIHRTIAAPIEQVWRAWTTVDGLRGWWWNHWAGVEFDLDLRIGGSYRIAPPHGEFALRGDYLAIEAPRHLAFSWQWVDQDGASVDEACDLTLEPVADGTALALRHTGAWITPAGADNYRIGWLQTLDALDHLFG